MFVCCLFRQKKENLERKKEEEKAKRQMILDQYRMRKAQEDAEKNGSSSSFSNHSSKDSNRTMSTLHLNRSARLRANSSGFHKPRPKSLHISASTIQDYNSLDPKAASISDDIETNYSTYSSSTPIQPSSSSRSTSRPQSAMSGNSGSSRRLPSPTSRLPPLPSSLSLGKYKSNFSDGASDAGSTFSEYTGPKLFVKPTQKSNRGIILNAINVVLAGAVNASIKKKVLEVRVAQSISQIN